MFQKQLTGDAEQKYLLASDAGYGFVATLGDLVSRNKAGKAMLTLPKGARVLAPVRLVAPETERLVAISNEGRMLVFAVAELPELARGKGNKIIGIPGKRLETREEFVSMIAVVPVGGSLTAYAGKRHITLKPSDLDSYQGERGRRGNKLPRGFQRVERVEVV